MPSKTVKVSEHVLARVDSYKSTLAEKWKVNPDSVTTNQAIDHLLTAALDIGGVPDVVEPPPDFSSDDDAGAAAG
jgi:hypothetical protein